jgi:hypothetical protein
MNGNPLSQPTLSLTTSNLLKGEELTRYAPFAIQGYLAHKEPPPPVGPYSSPVPRDLWQSQGSGCFL